MGHVVGLMILGGIFFNWGASVVHTTLLDFARRVVGFRGFLGTR